MGLNAVVLIALKTVAANKSGFYGEYFIPRHSKDNQEMGNTKYTTENLIWTGMPENLKCLSTLMSIPFCYASCLRPSFPTHFTQNSPKKTYLCPPF